MGHSVGGRGGGGVRELSRLHADEDRLSHPRAGRDAPRRPGLSWRDALRAGPGPGHRWGPGRDRGCARRYRGGGSREGACRGAAGTIPGGFLPFRHSPGGHLIAASRRDHPRLQVRFAADGVLRQSSRRARIGARGQGLLGASQSERRNGMGDVGARARAEGRHRGGGRRRSPSRCRRRVDRSPGHRRPRPDTASGRRRLAVFDRADAGRDPGRDGRHRRGGRQECRLARRAQQSLLGGNLRGEEIVPVAGKMDAIGFAAMEAFGGATFETQVRRREDPWAYLRKLNKATPNTPIQALIRGQNLVANRNFADDAVELFIKHTAKNGIDVFRVFDPLNDLRNMEAAIGAALKAKKRVQGALSYAVSPAHSIELWCSLAKGLVDMGAHDIVIKDTSGLLSPQATWELVTALKQVAKVPIDVHSHCSSGMAPMAYMAAVEAGAEILDVAMSPLAWGTSQPAAESVIAALQGGEYDTGLDLDKLWDVQHDVESLKREHIAELSPVADRVDASILRYQMPGQMLEDIFHQLGAHKAGGRISEVMEEANRVRRELGYPPLVAPIRQVIATQAVYNVIGGDRYATVTQELTDYLHGLYGRPPVPADPELRRLVLGREEPITIRPADLLEPQVDNSRQQVRKMGYEPSDDNVLIHLMFPSLAQEYLSGPPAKDSNGSKPQAPAPAPVASTRSDRKST